MATTTVALVRDRIAALITAMTPTSLASDTFRNYRYESDGEIRPWALGNPGCLRRFSVRQVPGDRVPLVSNVNQEQVRITIEIVVCYPQSHRYGDTAALGRDDVIRADSLQIDKATGMYGRANFASGSAYDACWVDGEVDVEQDEGVDFLVLKHTYLIYQSRS
jgi:hypothetical protein